MAKKKVAKKKAIKIRVVKMKVVKKKLTKKNEGNSGGNNIYLNDCNIDNTIKYDDNVKLMVCSIASALEENATALGKLAISIKAKSNSPLFGFDK